MLWATVREAAGALSGFAGAYQRHWDEGMAAKLGLPAPDRELATSLLELLRDQKVDYTGFFQFSQLQDQYPMRHVW